MGKLKPKTFGTFLLATVSFLSGCMTDPHRAYTAEQPKTAPMRNLTDMDLALGCLDRLLLEYRVQPTYITSTGLPNRAGGKVDLNSGADMLKTSIGLLSRSQAYRYVDLSTLAMTQVGGNAQEIGSRPIEGAAILQWAAFWEKVKKQGSRETFNIPEYIISGSISQLDNSVLSDKVDGSIGSEEMGSVGASQDQMLSVVTVDMQILNSLNLQVQPGLTTRNSLAIKRSGFGMDISGKIKTVGGYFNVSYDSSEGLHQGVRDLIQLGTLELLGRLAHVPYEQCLKSETVAPGALQTAEDNFESMSESQRIRYVQERLAVLQDPDAIDVHTTYYQGTASGILDAATRDAVARYRRRAGLIANAEIDLDLYRSLKSPPASAFAPSGSIRPAISGEVAPQLRFVTPQGRALTAPATFPLGSRLVFGITADKPGHAHCFLENQDHQIYRIFPTLGQSDDALIPGTASIIPSPATKIPINLDSKSSEAIACIAASQPFPSKVMPTLQRLGAAPLAGFSSVQQVLDEYQKAMSGAAVSMEVLPFDVE